MNYEKNKEIELLRELIMILKKKRKVSYSELLNEKNL